MTPSEIIKSARITLNDNDSAGYRDSDEVLLGFVNDAIREAAIVQPALFSTIADYTCVPDSCEQGITYADAAMLLEVLCIHGGNSVTPFDFPSMDAFHPSWRTDAEGPAQQWAKFANDPFKFYIYPKAPALTQQVLDVRYVRNPAANFDLLDAITELPDVYKTALHDYVVYRVSMKDDEFVDSNRATAFYNTYVSKLKGA